MGALLAERYQLILRRCTLSLWSRVSCEYLLKAKKRQTSSREVNLSGFRVPSPFIQLKGCGIASVCIQPNAGVGIPFRMSSAKSINWLPTPKPESWDQHRGDGQPAPALPLTN